MSLTEDDKQWLENQFGNFCGEIDQVRADRRQVRTEIGSTCGESGQVRLESGQVSAEFASVHSQLARFETNVLEAFRKLASSNEAWQSAHDAVLHALELDVQALQDRAAKLERADNA